MISIKFFCYYDQYLGVNSSKVYPGIYASNQRNIPLALELFHYLIITDRTGLIYSIAPQFYLEFEKYINRQKNNKIDEELMKGIDGFFKDKLPNYIIRKMYRLTVNNDLKILQCNKVRQLTIADKEAFLNSGKKAGNKIYKENKWKSKEELIYQGRVFGYIHNDKIVSWAEVSNIDFNGGNIVVNTVPEYGNLGYGKCVVAEAAKWCLNNNLLPIYWVDSLNTPSLNLAQSIGFKIMSEEVVVSTRGSN